VIATVISRLQSFNMRHHTAVNLHMVIGLMIDLMMGLFEGFEIEEAG
jgi:hypothetical protein